MDKFSSYDFAKLKKVHDLKQAQLARFSLKQILGVISATAALIIKSTPRNVIEGTFGMDYDEFEKDVFWATVFLAGYLLISFLLPWFKYYQARRTNQRVGDILEYAEIKNS
jgi:Mg2+ and Co2+ transporter CorA